MYKCFGAITVNKYKKKGGGGGEELFSVHKFEVFSRLHMDSPSRRLHVFWRHESELALKYSIQISAFIFKKLLKKGLAHVGAYFPWRMLYLNVPSLFLIPPPPPDEWNCSVKQISMKNDHTILDQTVLSLCSSHKSLAKSNKATLFLSGKFGNIKVKLSGSKVETCK